GAGPLSSFPSSTADEEAEDDDSQEEVEERRSTEQGPTDGTMRLHGFLDSRDQGSGWTGRRRWHRPNSGWWTPSLFFSPHRLPRQRRRCSRWSQSPLSPLTAQRGDPPPPQMVMATPIPSLRTVREMYRNTTRRPGLVRALTSGLGPRWSWSVVEGSNACLSGPRR
ncbi:unnamed protein product, partial [Urochloa humidicola]